MKQPEAPAANVLRRICVFCGHPVRDPATKRTRAREHVFPFWMLDELGIVRHTIEFSPFEATRGDGTSLQMTEQTPIRRLDFNSFVLGAVCSTCNNGWMSRLESRVKPNLLALISNNAAKSSDADSLAKWALKTTYVLWRYLEPPVGEAPLRHGRQLVGDAMALPKHVAVFHRQAADWRVWFSVCMTFTVEGPNPKAIQRSYKHAHKVLLQLGHAQFLVQYFPYNGSEVAYDPALCNVLAANMPAVQEPSLNPAGAGITDPNFLFMMSNLIRKSTAQQGR